MHYNSNIEYKYQRRDVKNTQTQKNKKKRKTTNKAKEVKDWETWETMTKQENSTKTSTSKNIKMVWVPGTIPMKIIKKMKWGDLNELTDEEYGYFKTSES